MTCNLSMYVFMEVRNVFGSELTHNTKCNSSALLHLVSELYNINIMFITNDNI